MGSKAPGLQNQRGLFGIHPAGFAVVNSVVTQRLNVSVSLFNSSVLVLTAFTITTVLTMVICPVHFRRVDIKRSPFRRG